MERVRKKPKLWDNTHKYEENSFTTSKRRERLEMPIDERKKRKKMYSKSHYNRQ